MRLIDAEPIIEMLKRVRKDADSPRRDLDLLNLQQLLEFVPEIALPPNTPLTLEELREMDGEPVWIIPMRGSGGFRTWMLVDAEYELCREAHGEMAVFENCGKTWLAYRRRPEEGTV